MKKTKAISKVFVLFMMLTMICTQSIASFAAKGTVDSDRTDYVTNHTSNSTELRQANSNNTGTIRLGKILTVNQKNKFPNIEDFVYKITPVAAWDNQNVDTTKSGVNIPAADMPKPLVASTEHHRITNIDPDGSTTLDSTEKGPWTTLVSIGNFKDKDAANTSSVTKSDAASNTDKIEENYRRTRTTDVSFKFSKAGYYMYRIEEVGSSQNGSVTSLDSLTKNVAGVDYDNNSYYVVFYVCNRQATADVGPNEYGQGTQKGDTVGQQNYRNDVNTDGTQTQQYVDDSVDTHNTFDKNSGVYVHTITSWTNQYQNTLGNKNATDYKPDNSMRDSQNLADAQNDLHDLMNDEDVDDVHAYNNGGHSAEPNTGKVDDNNNGVVDGYRNKSNGSNGAAGTNAANQGPSTVTHDNLGKVGISDPVPPTTSPTAGNPPSPDPSKPANSPFGGPNELEAFRMWNAQDTHDVVLKKNVTGNLGDRTKRFEFEITLTGLERNQTYTTNVAAGNTEDAHPFDGRNNTTGDELKTDDTTGDQTRHQSAVLPSGGRESTTSGITLYGFTGGTLNNNGAGGCPEFTTDSGNGTTSSVTFRVKLRDDEILVLNSLPRSASYQIKEFKSDHVPQYNIVSTNKRTDSNPAVFTETGHTPGGNDADHLGTANTASNTELQTKLEFVDRYDGTVTVIYQNNRDLATITGVAGLDYMVYAVIVAFLGLMAFVIIRRRREYAEEDFYS